MHALALPPVPGNNDGQPQSLYCRTLGRTQRQMFVLRCRLSFPYALLFPRIYLKALHFRRAFNVGLERTRWDMYLAHCSPTISALFFAMQVFGLGRSRSSGGPAKTEVSPAAPRCPAPFRFQKSAPESPAITTL